MYIKTENIVIYSPCREYLLSTLLYLTVELLREGPPVDRNSSLPVSLSAVLLKVWPVMFLWASCYLLHHCFSSILPPSPTDPTGVLPSCLNGDPSI